MAGALVDRFVTEMLERGSRRAFFGMEHLTFIEPSPVATTHPTEPLMTAAQVAVLLAVPRSSVYEYARRTDHPIPSVLIGRHRRFVRADVLAWVGSLARS